MRVGVVGCGSIGTRHIGNLCELGVEVAAFDADPDRREAVASEFGIEVYGSEDDLWDSGPDAAVVAVPNALHVPVAERAAAAGCHLFVEKPLSHTMAGVDDLVRTVERNGLVSLVGCNLRFHPGIETIHDLLDEDRIGRVVAAQFEVGSYLPDWHPDEDYRERYSARQDLGGGVILDAIHEIDYARWLLGGVERVSCFADRLGDLEIETEDTAGILLRFETGAIGEIHMDYVQREYSRGCKVVGRDGAIRWRWGDGVVRLFDPESDDWEHRPLDDAWEVNDMYVEEMRHFVECVESGTETTCDVRDGRAALAVALAAKESAGSGIHVSPG